MKFSGEDFVAVAAAVAVALAQGLNSGDVEILGEFFSLIGQNLTMISDRREQLAGGAPEAIGASPGRGTDAV